jgi:hypothetical protein
VIISSSPALGHGQKNLGIIRGLLRIAFMRPTATKNVVSCQDIFYPLHDICYRLSVSRRNDLEAIIAFRATPNMNNASLIPMFGPLGKQQLATTLEASHLEFGMPIRCRPHCESPRAFATTYLGEEQSLRANMRPWASTRVKSRSGYCAHIARKMW